MDLTFAGGTTTATLPRLINRLLEPSAGEVWYGEKAVGRYDPLDLRRAFGVCAAGLRFVPGDYWIDIHMS